MRIVKYAFTVTLLSALIFMNKAVLASDFGVVNIEKIVKEYSKTQNASIDLKVKEAEIQKFLADARKAVQSAKTKQKQKELEEQYGKELQLKLSSYKEEKAKEVTAAQNDIYNAIKLVANKKQIKMIFDQNSVIIGADDITNDVILELNSISPIETK